MFTFTQFLSPDWFIPQFGIAAGFLLPTLMVKDGTNDEIAGGLSVMFYGTAIVTSVVFIAVLLGKIFFV